MDVIPFARFVLALFGSGLLMYIFTNVIDMIEHYFDFAIGNPYYVIIHMIFSGVLIIVILREGMFMLRSLQRRRGIT